MREELRERRAAFWAKVAPVATGVFLGQIAFSAIAFVVVVALFDVTG